MNNINTPKYKLLGFDITVHHENCLVHFENVISKKEFSKKLKDIYENKILIENFSREDAAKIGYKYGKYISNQK